MAVIESFKNFIRHGKQARQDSPLAGSANAAAAEKAYREQQARELQAKAQAERLAQEQAAAAAAAAQQQKGQPVYDEAAARIVAEEREAKGKLPHYPGLEKYKLVVKMGE